MKKTGMFNQPISNLIAGMGHTDSLVIGDAGLPIPSETERFDLALRCGLPSVTEVLDAVLQELEVERAAIAEETRENSPDMYRKMTELLGGRNVEIISHEELKARCATAKGVVRTGECTPFSNVILYSGVVF